MKITPLTRSQVIAAWSARGGNFTLTDLRTGTVLRGRGSPPVNYCHTDFQWLTEADWRAATRIGGRSWAARPALLETDDGCVTPVSYHTFNHSIRVASGAFDIVGPPRIIRGRGPAPHERDEAGNWRPGHHMCMHYIDSWRARSDTAYTREMRAAVEEAAALLAPPAAAPLPPVPSPAPLSATHEETSIARAFDAGILTERAHWLDVVRGAIPARPRNVLHLIDNALAVIEGKG